MTHAVPNTPVIQARCSGSRVATRQYRVTSSNTGRCPQLGSSQTYALRREEEAGNALMLEVRSTGGCPGDASFAAPYVHPYYVNRLDDRILVLVSGVTAEVTGLRRRGSR